MQAPRRQFSARSSYIADNTIVFYSADNGSHPNTRPDAAATPFRGWKNSNREGGWRVPAVARWPGRIAEGGVEALGRSYKVHLDGDGILPLLTGETEASPRDEIFYLSDDGDLTALRFRDWKPVSMEQNAEHGFRAWTEPFVPLIPNLRRDPYERGVWPNSYYDRMLDRAYVPVPAQAHVAEVLETFQAFPPRQKAASFSLDQIMEKMQAGLSSNRVPLRGARYGPPATAARGARNPMP